MYDETKTEIKRSI